MESLPPTLTQSLITLIPKPKKDLLLIDNWRPISLLNPFKTFIVSKFKLSIDVNCTFCDSHPETVLHLFWHCVHTRKLWQDICQFIVNFIHNDFELFFKDVLFGIFTFEKQYGNIFFLCNLIILLAKYFIHKCKVMKVTTNFSYFQEDIKIYIKCLSTSYNQNAIKTLNVCSLFGVFV